MLATEIVLEIRRLLDEGETVTAGHLAADERQPRDGWSDRQWAAWSAWTRAGGDTRARRRLRGNAVALPGLRRAGLRTVRPMPGARVSTAAEGASHWETVG